MNDLYGFNARKVKDEIVEWIRMWFAANGPGCNAVIGISGGKDSTVAAALCVEALGRKRVIGVLMPSGEQSDIKDSYDICNHLGIEYTEINIEEAVKAVALGYCTATECMYSKQSKINLSPRLRMAVLYFVAQSHSGRVVNTCNLSEDFVGYSTRWGDDVGDFCPLRHLTSDEVVAIGHEIDLPASLVEKVPSDGLCGKTDEDNLGFSYAVLNKYIRTGQCEDDEVRALIEAKHKQNLFKLRMPDSFRYLTDAEKSIGARIF